MNVKQFLNELRQDVANNPEHPWFLDGGALRRSIPRHGDDHSNDDYANYAECPIVAVANSAAGEWGYWSVNEWENAADWLGLPAGHAIRLMRAADNLIVEAQPWEPADSLRKEQALRIALLAALGLREQDKEETAS